MEHDPLSPYIAAGSPSVSAGSLPSSLLELNVFGWPYTGLVTLFTLGLYYFFVYQVRRARVKHNVPAPQMTGPEEFMRAMRVHQNTLEQLIVFLPLVWLTAFAARDEVAAGLGVIWPLSRMLYAFGYLRDPKNRTMGFFIGFIVILALFIVSTALIIRSLFIW
jgi:uncharacterized MAPEG superfamily protein